jgi:tetratricopeptide (TPR) repeat protein
MFFAGTACHRSLIGLRSGPKQLMMMKRIIQEVPREEIRHLRAAEGWLALGNYLEAHEELDRVHPEYRTHPDYLLLRVAMLRDGGAWKRILPVAQTLIGLLPKDPNCWLLRSQALHGLGRTKEAYEALAPMAETFRTRHEVHYNLARYAAQLGRLDEARSWLEAAFEVASDAEKLKLLALDDPGLNALWAETT